MMEQVYSFWEDIVNSKDKYGQDVCDKEPLSLCETFIQALWNEITDGKSFYLTCGTKVEILYHGRWNDEPGPDFLDARVVIDGHVKCGDIELHLNEQDWYLHQHDENREFDNVILHVVWYKNDCGLKLPTLVLSDQVSSEVIDQFNRFDLSSYPTGLKYPPSILAPFLISKSDAYIREFFLTVSEVRFKRKVSSFKKKIIENGFDYALLYGICDALGYKNNREPFQHLADYLYQINFFNYKIEQQEAILWGVSGLLPDPTTSPVLPELSNTVKDLWQRWWSLRLDDLPAIKWSRRGRPFNSPERRVAALYELVKSDFFGQISNSNSVALKQGTFENLLSLPDSSFSELVNFSKKIAKPGALIGSARMNQIVVNVLLPLMAYDDKLYSNALHTFKNTSCIPDNHLLKEAVGRFFIPPARAKNIICNNGVQQGIIEVIKVSHLMPEKFFKPLASLLMTKKD